MKDQIQAQTSHREAAQINKSQVKNLKKHKSGKYTWVANNNTIFSFATKAKMNSFIKDYESKSTVKVR